VSQDASGKTAFRMSLQTREQHIRREKATSNICTAQVLLAVVAAMYAVYHGPEGLAAIARRVHRRAATLAAALQQGGVELVATSFFDTIQARVPGRAAEVVVAAAERGINLRWVDDDTVGVACDETTTVEHVAAVAAAFGVAPPDDVGTELLAEAWPEALGRTTEFCTHPVFHEHRSETAMLRFLRRLSDRDLALDRSMIPLGSCTMKLNATAEMEPISWPGFAGVHPFAPEEQARGYRRLVDELAGWLAETTG
jgi:glycine dehydrogenase